MAKTRSVIDTVGSQATETKTLPFRWYVNVGNLSDGKVPCTVGFHSERPNGSSGVGGESHFEFDLSEINDVIPMAYWYNKYLVINAMKRIANQFDDLNDDLTMMAIDRLGRLPRNSSTSAMDTCLVEAFSRETIVYDKTRLGERVTISQKKPDNDPFIWRLRIVALLEACKTLINRTCIGFDEHEGYGGIERY